MGAEEAVPRDGEGDGDEEGADLTARPTPVESMDWAKEDARATGVNGRVAQSVDDLLAEGVSGTRLSVSATAVDLLQPTVLAGETVSANPSLDAILRAYTDNPPPALHGGGAALGRITFSPRAPSAPPKDPWIERYRALTKPQDRFDLIYHLPAFGGRKIFDRYWQACVNDGGNVVDDGLLEYAESYLLRLQGQGVLFNGKKYQLADSDHGKFLREIPPRVTVKDGSNLYQIPFFYFLEQLRFRKSTGTDDQFTILKRRLRDFDRLWAYVVQGQEFLNGDLLGFIVAFLHFHQSDELTFGETHTFTTAPDKNAKQDLLKTPPVVKVQMEGHSKLLTLKTVVAAIVKLENK